jgi:hypothetical protein
MRSLPEWTELLFHQSLFKSNWKTCAQKKMTSSPELRIYFQYFIVKFF